MQSDLKLSVVFNKVKYPIEIQNESTIGDLKYLVYESTGVQPSMQRFENSEIKDPRMCHNTKLKELFLRNNEVLHLRELFPNKIEPSTSRNVSRQSRYFSAPSLQKNLYLNDNGLRLLDYPRRLKNLLVLDLDRTIYDGEIPTNVAEQFSVRPYVDHLFNVVSRYYDIMIWSATSMRFIDEKMTKICKTHNADYKILCYIDINPIVTIQVPNFGYLLAKPLAYIWERFPGYNRSNSVICDDSAASFYFNVENGIPVQPYRYTNFKSDNELLKLAVYLRHLAEGHRDFSMVDHSSWKTHIQVQKRRNFGLS